MKIENPILRRSINGFIAVIVGLIAGWAVSFGLTSLINSLWVIVIMWPVLSSMISFGIGFMLSKNYPERTGVFVAGISFLIAFTLIIISGIPMDLLFSS